MLVGSWKGLQYLQNRSKSLLCASFVGEPGPCPKAALDFLSGLPFSPFPN